MVRAAQPRHTLRYLSSNFHTDFVRIPREGRAAGRSLRQLDIRHETGATIIAVQRGRETIPSPDPDFVVGQGDTVVALGTREELAALDRLLGRA